MHSSLGHRLSSIIITHSLNALWLSGVGHDRCAGTRGESCAPWHRHQHRLVHIIMDDMFAIPDR